MVTRLRKRKHQKAENPHGDSPCNSCVIVQRKPGIIREKAGTPEGAGVSHIPQKNLISHRYLLFGIYRELLPRILLIRWSPVRIWHGLPRHSMACSDAGQFCPSSCSKSVPLRPLAICLALQPWTGCSQGAIRVIPRLSIPHLTRRPFPCQAAPWVRPLRQVSV